MEKISKTTLVAEMKDAYGQGVAQELAEKLDRMEKPEWFDRPLTQHEHLLALMLNQLSEADVDLILRVCQRLAENLPNETKAA